MKRRILSGLSLILAAWMDTWLLFPIIFSLYLWSLASIPLHTFGTAVIGAYLSGAAARRLLIRKNRFFAIAVSLAAGLGFGLLLGKDTSSDIVLSIMTFASACRGIFIAERPHHISFPRIYCYISLLVYFSAYFLYGRLIAVRQFQGYILIAGLIAIPTIFLAINSDLLMQASSKDLSKSSSMPVVRRNNRIIVILTLLIAALIAGYNSLKDTVLHLLKAAVFFIAGLIEMLLNLLYTPGTGEQGPPTGGLPELPPGEPAKTSPFWNIVIEIFAYIVLSVLVVFALVFLVKQLIKLFKFLTELIKKLMSDGRWSGDSYGYSDEKETLIDWQAIKQNYTAGIKDWLERILRTEPKWSQLTDNRQKVRYLYRHLVLKSIDSGYRFHIWRTPKEVMEDLAEQGFLKDDTKPVLEDLYGKARYGKGTISDIEVEELRRQFQE